jgi:hypothetical protein
VVESDCAQREGARRHRGRAGESPSKSLQHAELVREKSPGSGRLVAPWFVARWFVVPWFVVR